MKPAPPARPLRLRSRRAALLIITLWVGIILSIMAFSLAYDMQVNQKLTSQTEKRMRARTLARAGMAKASLDLRNDRLAAIADPAGARGDTYLDPWAVSEDKTEIEIGGGEYTVRVVDEHSKLNLNNFHQQNYAILAHLIKQLGDLKQDEADQIAMMIVDWQDPDSEATGAGGYESEHWTDYGLENYGDLLPADWVFVPRNDVMLTVEELMEIPGITREMLYGPGEEDDDPRARLRRRREARDRDDFDQRAPALIEYVTTQSARTMNLNTAPSLVIESLFAGGGNPSGAESLAEQFVEFRARTMDSKGGREMLSSPDALIQGSGIPQEEVSRIRQFYPVGVDSNMFTIIARGTYGGVSVTLEAKVDVQPDAFNTEQLGRKNDEGVRDPEARGEIRTRTQFVVDPAVRVREMREY